MCIRDSHKSVKTPFLTEDACAELFAASCKNPVELIERGHHAVKVRPFYQHLKRFQIQLSGSTFGENGIYSVIVMPSASPAVSLLLIDGKMLGLSLIHIFYVMVAPALLWFLIFCYTPMFGIGIALSLIHI